MSQGELAEAAGCESCSILRAASGKSQRQCWRRLNAPSKRPGPSSSEKMPAAAPALGSQNEKQEGVSGSRRTVLVCTVKRTKIRRWHDGAYDPNRLGSACGIGAETELTSVRLNGANGAAYPLACSYRSTRSRRPERRVRLPSWARRRPISCASCGWSGLAIPSSCCFKGSGAEPQETPREADR